MKKYLYSIATTLVAALFFGFLIPLSIGLVYSLRGERAQLESELAMFHEHLLHSFEVGMENSLLNFEPNEAQSAARLPIEDPRVLGIKVYSSIYGMTLAELAKVPRRSGALPSVKRRYVVSGGENVGYVEVTIDAAYYEEKLIHERANIILLFASMLVCGLLLAIPVISFKVLRPLRRLMRQAERFSAGELETALEWKGYDELSKLGNTFETMRQKLHASFLRIQELAVQDELTGMPNRRAFYKDAAKVLEYCRRYRQSLTIALMDIDHFKQINDALGHAAGDRILQDFAGCILSMLRRTDICARIGGEEFVLCMPGTNLLEAESVAEKFRSGLAVHEFPYGQTVTVSIGLALDTGVGGLDEIVHKADLAMYQAKNQGRNRVAVSRERPLLEEQ